jgi:uncharacterized protein with HEPN domain
MHPYWPSYQWGGAKLRELIKAPGFHLYEHVNCRGIHCQRFQRIGVWTTSVRGNGTQLAVLEMLLGGTTTYTDMYYFEEVIGEATKNLSEDLRAANPSIPWRQIAGMRDVLIHDYLKVNLSRVWRTVESDLPPLDAAVQRLLQQDSPQL